MKERNLTATAHKIWMAIFIAIPFAFSTTIYEGAFLPKLLATQLLLIPLFFIALLHNHWPRCAPAILLSITCYLLLYALSITQAPNALEATFNISQHFGFIIIPFLIITTLNIQQFTQIASVAAWASLPIAAIGLAQYLGIDVGIPSNAQPSATFYHRNAAAAYLICVIPLTWMGLQHAKNKRVEYAWSLLLVIQGTFLVFTRTRAAWVALLGTAIILYITTRWLVPTPKRSFKIRPIILCLCLVLLTSLLPENIQGNRRQKFDEKKSDAATAVASMFTPEGNRGRIDLWQNTLAMIVANPLGIGAGNWQFMYPAYAQGQHINVKAAPERPHNDLLWIAAELGIAGLIVFLVILWHALQLAKTRITQATSDAQVLTLSLCGIVLAYIIDGLFSFPHGQVMPTIFFWFALGGLVLLHIEADDRRQPISHRLPWAFGLLVMCLSLVITTQRLRYDQHHLHVHTAERNQDWQTVIDKAEQAAQIGAYRANTFIALGRAYYRTGQLEPALQAYQTGLRLHPNSLNAYNNLGIVQRRQGSPEEAVASFQKAIAIFPRFVEAHFNLGLAYFDLEAYQKSETMHQKVISWGLNTPQVYFSLGRVYHKQSDLLKAQEQYLLSLQRDPNFAPAQRALSLLGVSQ